MEEARILEQLGGFRRRYRWIRLADACARGALVGGVVALAAALALKTAGCGPATVAWALVPVVGCPLLAALHVLLTPVREAVVAREVDRRGGLHERVSTAVEWILERRGQTLMARAQLRDALAALSALQPKAMFPLRLPRQAVLAAALAIAVAVLLLLPRWSLFGGPAVALDAPDLAKPAEALEQAAEALAPRSAEAPPMPELARAAEEMRELARDMRTGQMSEREALARIAEARESVERSLDDVRRQRDAAGEGGREADKAPRRDGEPAAGGAASPSPGAATKADPSKKSEAQQGKRALTAAEREALRKAREALAKKAGALEKAAEKLERARSCVNGQVAQTGGSPQAANGGQAEALSKAGSEQQGAAPTENKGQATRAGKGKGEADFGKGTTDQQQQGKSVQPRTTVLDRQSAERKRWTVAWHKLYGAERKDLKSAATKVKGDRTDKGESMQTSEEVRAAPDAIGQSSLEEQSVYVDARRRAEESMTRETVPEEYRDLVRSYFEEINPGDSRRQEK